MTTDKGIEAAARIAVLEAENITLRAENDEQFVVVSTDAVDSDGFNIEQRFAWKDIFLARAEAAESSLAALKAEVVEVVGPFDGMSRELFARNYNSSDIAMALMGEVEHGNPRAITAGQFFAIRALITKIGG